MPDSLSSLLVIPSSTPSVANTASPGRPNFNISRVVLKMYLNYGFTLKKISQIIGVNMKTVCRRIRQFDLTVLSCSDILHENLDAIVLEIYHGFPNCGIRRMKRFLQARNLRIQWEHVRSSIWRDDQQGLLLRTMQLNIVRRRHYSVAKPLSLWHLDGN